MENQHFHICTKITKASKCLLLNRNSNGRVVSVLLMSFILQSDRHVRANNSNSYSPKSSITSNSPFDANNILLSISPFKASSFTNLIHKPVVISCSKILEAPGIEDDFYTENLTWSNKNVIAVSLKPNIYLYHPTSGKVQELQLKQTKQIANGGSEGISSLAWNTTGDVLSVGYKNGTVKVWDLISLKCIVEKRVHSCRIATLSWNENVLSSGSKDYSIQNLDLRAKALTCSYKWHSGEVCGLKWDHGGNRLLSGGDDNQVCLWDIRKGNEPSWAIGDFHGAVKALDWCPNDTALFATGGGSTDRKIRVWSTKSNSCLDIVDTGSQICSLIWAKPSNQIISSHGFIENDIAIWKYPKLTKSVVLKGHSLRVLHMAASPDYSTIVSTSGDETLRLWKIASSSSSRCHRNFSNDGLFSKLLK